MPTRYTLWRRIGGRIAVAWRRVTTPSPFWQKLGEVFSVGHRGAFLIAFGLIFVTLGAGIVLSPAPPNVELIHTRLPIPFRVLLWSAAGAVAIGVARSKQWQWVGFAALTFPPAERFLSYVAAIVIDLTNGGGPPVPWPYLNGAALYLAIVFVARLVASWPDPVADQT